MLGVCTGGWLWEKNPLPHRGLEPAPVLRLTFQSDAVPTELSRPLGYSLGVPVKFRFLRKGILSCRLKRCRTISNTWNERIMTMKMWRKTSELIVHSIHVCNTSFIILVLAILVAPHFSLYLVHGCLSQFREMSSLTRVLWRRWV